MALDAPHPLGVAGTGPAAPDPVPGELDTVAIGDLRTDADLSRGRPVGQR
jgi:hypothetical protein